MALLHDEDPVGPSDVPSSDTDPSIVIRACRAYLIQVMVLEKLLGREAADPILAADEQELLALGHRSMLGHRAMPRARDRSGVRSVLTDPAPLGYPLTKLLEDPFHQILPLHHQMPEFVPLRSRHFSLQCRQVIGQQIPQQDGLSVRKD
jgi:hypothetical protein